MRAGLFDLFRIGIGPSSSHTVGPMRAAGRFARNLDASGCMARTVAVRVELFGSLGLTGRGHASDMAVLLGLEGETPECVDIAGVEERLARIRATNAIRLLGKHRVGFEESTDLVFNRSKSLPRHPNGMRFNAFDASGTSLLESTCYSVGGGFVVDESDTAAATSDDRIAGIPFPFKSALELLGMCGQQRLSISEIMRANERVCRSDAQIDDGVAQLWNAMRECVRRGCETDGVLPGGLKVKRRAAALHRQLIDREVGGAVHSLAPLDWVNVWAIAVNEENAAGGRVVTAPTNGAAGIVPAVLHYYICFTPEPSESAIRRFLLTAAAIGFLYKENASISGAEVGCQGEVGVACSMAAAALAEVLGGSPAQVENAAEIGMEHNLGLTCDPVGGLVQIPCIERNAVGAIKAINAARMALAGDGSHYVSLDNVIQTMRQTGADMHVKYKETARGGLAISAVQC